MRKTITGFIILLMAIRIAAQEKQELLYADPIIYVAAGHYYLTGTGGNSEGPAGFSVLQSTDLKNWSTTTGSSDSVAMLLTKGDHVFGTDGFWAPQLFNANNRYYLAYTANEQTALASSGSLLGPYGQAIVTAIDSTAKNIDPFIFQDEDGKAYLYHVRFDQGNYLWVAEFDWKKGCIKKETLTKCFEQTAPWEATPAYQSAPIMEGPTVIKLKNKYYLFYSANHFRNIDYSVGYAIADTPYGPWIKQKNNPILHRSIVGENGSGHGDIFQGLDGQLYYVYHVHFSARQVSPRKTRIVPLLNEWDESVGHYTFRVKADEIIIPRFNH